jgi:hypothetical protein
MMARSEPHSVYNTIIAPILTISWRVMNTQMGHFLVTHN